MYYTARFTLALLATCYTASYVFCAILRHIWLYKLTAESEIFSSIEVIEP